LVSKNLFFYETKIDIFFFLNSGIVGGISIGMLSAILLVMFIIYRMRKKDEGSYALEEAPRKSPSHAYTRVSSREFFA
jgi:hypothetical protein